MLRVVHLLKFRKNPDLWIIFTDGACKKGSSVGGVLVSPTGRIVVMFRDNLSNIFFKKNRKISYPI